MTRSQWSDAAIRQLWAEGIDGRALFGPDATVKPHQVDNLLQHRSELPMRDALKYRSPDEVRVGAPLMALFVEQGSLVPWLERLLGGALQGAAVTGVQDGQLDRITHWRLNLALGHGFPTPDRVVQLWADHPNRVQDTPAEQQILHWHRGHEPWLTRWHPYREGSGAMRRALLWGAIYRVPEQAAVAAAGDARAAYSGWGIWTAAVVAYAVSGLPQGWTPHDGARRCLYAMTRVDPKWPGIADLDALLRADFPGGSWDAWRHTIDREFSGYPDDHSLPNLLLILGVLYWYPEASPEETGDLLQGAGWDVLGNRLIAGALMGRRAGRIDIDPDALNLMVEATVKAHGHPPNARGQGI
jgi:hypothetical protein